MGDMRYQVVEADRIVDALRGCRRDALWVFMVMVGRMSFYDHKDGGQLVTVDQEAEGFLMEVAHVGSRKTLGDILRELCAAGVVRKVRTGTYQVNPRYAYRGDGYYRDMACRRWEKGDG